jgi:hypothetical protein
MLHFVHPAGPGGGSTSAGSGGRTKPGADSSPAGAATPCTLACRRCCP